MRRTCRRNFTFTFFAATAATRRLSAASSARATQSTSGNGPPSGAGSGATCVALISSIFSLVRTIASTNAPTPSRKSTAGQMNRVGDPAAVKSTSDGSLGL